MSDNLQIPGSPNIAAPFSGTAILASAGQPVPNVAVPGLPAPTPAPSPAPTSPAVSQPDLAALVREAIRAELAAAAPQPRAAQSSPARQPEPWSDLAAEVQALKQERINAQVTAKRGDIEGQVLSTIPEANRALAGAVLRGQLSAFQIGPDTDAAQIVSALDASMRAQFPTLYQAAGSTWTALPKTASGDYDWSGVHSWDQIPPDLMSKTPPEVVARLMSGKQTQGSQFSGPLIPRNMF